jgi:Icc-related predicted phosphoesterase
MSEIKLNKKVIVTGDIHNDFGHLNTLINKKRPELVICCGDFGYWPLWGNPLSDIKTQGAKILWCDGNHEDHWRLRDRTTDELAPNVFYMPRGSTYTLDDGRNILFMGGADSIDKHMRKEGLDWFREEVITQKDLYDLPDIKADIFITHTCPVGLVNDLRRFYEKDVEPSNWALTELHKHYKPDLWFFGHWHMYREGVYFGTKWHCLSYPRQGEKWWMYLPD